MDHLVQQQSGPAATATAGEEAKRKISNDNSAARARATANNNGSLPSSRSFEVQQRPGRAASPPKQGNGGDKSQQQQLRGGRLGPVKSLESATGAAAALAATASGGQLAGASKSDHDHEEQRQQQQQLRASVKSSNAGPQPPAQSQARQMFGLRQLTAPRTLTGGSGGGTGKKQLAGSQTSASTTTTTSRRIPFKLKVQNSGAGVDKKQLASLTAAQQQDSKSRHRPRGGSSQLARSSSPSSNSSDSSSEDSSSESSSGSGASQSSGSADEEEESSHSRDDSQDDSQDDDASARELAHEQADRTGAGSQDENAENQPGALTTSEERVKGDRKPRSASGKMRNAHAKTKTGGGKTRRRKSRARRSSCCPCEPIINRIDSDCQPVTDVDLVTYRHLCQLEQKQQQLRAHQRRGGGRRAGGQNQGAPPLPLPPPGTAILHISHGSHLGGLARSPTSAGTEPGLGSSASGNTGRGAISSSNRQQQQQLKRRSSLQEESGAYYQLCVSAEEQAIRAKYVWFPPSLRTLALVDQFFSYFPKDKIPYNFLASGPGACASASAGAGGPVDQQQQAAAATSGSGKKTPQPSSGGTSGSTNSPQQDSKAAQVTPQQTATNVDPQQQQQQQVSSGASATSTTKQPASSLACASYRDEQISFQLPRQDISLDYCSYHMSEPARSSYAAFVDKRNSQSLDVGSVIQIRLAASVASNGTAAGGGELSLSSNASGKQRPAAAAATARKMSTTSQQQVVLLVGAAKPSELAQLAASSSSQLAPAAAPLTSQRCRRCLVRFEDQQLAVVAPNFAIGTPGPPQGAHATMELAALDVLLATGGCGGGSSRRNSVSVQQAPTVATLEENIVMSRHHHQPQQKKTHPTSAATTAGPKQQHLAMFHPNCFTCATCKEFLVDLVYCLREGKLYCLRHYGESLRPRCSWCRELIFSDEYLKAMNENFHVDHFLCRHCDSNLAGQRYVLKEEKPYCIGCYEENFANTCEECQKAIGIDSRDLSYKERHWHDTCFACQQCQASLIDKPFGSKEDKVYCADCYDSSFATRCDGCKNPFRAGSKKMEYRGRQWHDSCFCCCMCQNTIGSNSFIPKNEEIYCIKCYEDKYATRCTKCKQVIVSGGVTFRNEPWHRDCFNCCNCNKSLAGQRFTTKDPPAASGGGGGGGGETTTTTTNLNKTNQPHNAYCIECYGELFAKKCFACSQAITGLGGTRFVTFEERSWHNDCFICTDCQTTLVGKGFITDGPDTILCGECARAKLR